MPRFSAVSTTTLGLSTWQVTTSTPLSMRVLVASASLTGLDQSPVKMTEKEIFGLMLLAPNVKALILRSTWGMGLAATKPSLSDLVEYAATIPDRYSHSSI